MRKAKKRRQLTNKRKRFLIANAFLALLLFLGIGYSALSTNLNFFGSITVKEYLEPTLYNVLKKASQEGYAKEYNGEHHDSFTENPSQKIYHWYADNNTEGTAILDKNNVIFAGQCWQMIRTTDTGGVKMIYNGEAENNQCLNTRGTHVGYDSYTSLDLASNYWYGTDYIYDSSLETFKLSGATEQVTWNATTGPGLIGKYTCKNTNVDGTCTTLYLVESYYDTSRAYVMKLNSNSNYSQFGSLKFNTSSNSSPAKAGYMYNTRYTYDSKFIADSEYILTSSSLSTSYWYADSVTWGSPTVNRYNLDNPFQVTSSADYQSLVGKYTFKNATQNYTNATVNYIAAVNGSTMYYFILNNSANHTLSDSNYTLTYGDSYTDNEDGTYTINNPTTIERKDWYSKYYVLKNKYVCKNAVNNTCSELWYTLSNSNTTINYISSTNNYKYAKGFTWDGSKYVLDNDTSTSFFEWNYTIRTRMNNAHYTCWNTDGICTTISYVYYVDDYYDDDPVLHYINLTNGKSVEDAVNEMLYNSDVNQKNSVIKSGIDAWYKKYILPYDEKVEDTIFCNDRSLENANTTGWNPNGGSVSTPMYFKGHSVTTQLSCTNITDRFSVSNPNAPLTYKVGLMSSPEMNIINNSNARKAGGNYWLGSPYYYSISQRSSVAVGNYVGGNSGNIYSNVLDNNIGVRPAISLKPGVKYLDGDGSMESPYYVGEDN